MIPDINESLNRLHKQVVAVLAENARLRDQNAKLKRFARHGILEIAWRGCEWDGVELQDLAEKLGLVVTEPYDPDDDDHGAGADMELDPGETLYLLVDWLREDADG